MEEQQERFRNYVLKSKKQNKKQKIHPDLILVQSIKNSYAQPIIKEIIEMDRFNDLLEKGDEFCFETCFTHTFQSKELRDEIKEFHRDQAVCHSNCLDKLKFTKEIMLNNLRSNSNFFGKVLRFQNHPDIKKLNDYEAFLKKEMGYDESIYNRIKSLV